MLGILFHLLHEIQCIAVRQIEVREDNIPVLTSQLLKALGHAAGMLQDQAGHSEEMGEVGNPGEVVAAPLPPLPVVEARRVRQGRASGQARYFFGLLWRGGLLYLALNQLFVLTLELTHVGHGNYTNWYTVVRSVAFDGFLYLLVGSIYLPFLYQQHAAEVRLTLKSSTLKEESTVP